MILFYSDAPNVLLFWSILGYNLFTHTPILNSIAVAFICAYIALWVDLLLTLISGYYENIYKSLGAEEPKNNRNNKANNNQDKKVKNS